MLDVEIDPVLAARVVDWLAVGCPAGCSDCGEALSMYPDHLAGDVLAQAMRTAGLQVLWDGDSATRVLVKPHGTLLPDWLTNAFHALQAQPAFAALVDQLPGPVVWAGIFIGAFWCPSPRVMSQGGYPKRPPHRAGHREEPRRRPGCARGRVDRADNSVTK